MKQIAERAGVAPQTVANVLQGRNKGAYAKVDERAELIRSIANELGYLPNAAARATARGRFDAIALLIPDDGGAWTSPGFLGGFTQAAREADLSIVLADLPCEELDDPGSMPKVMRELSVDGVLISHIVNIPQAAAQILRQQKTPSIWVNTLQDGDNVRFDDETAAYELADRLIGLGHQRLGYYMFRPDEHHSQYARRRGIARRLGEAGLPTDLPGVIGEELGCWHEFARNELLADDRPTAVIAYNEFELCAFARAASELGLRIPQDLSLTGFVLPDKILEFSQCSRMEVPDRALAINAVEMLVRKIEAPAAVQPERVLAMNWVDGCTIGPLNG